MYEVNSTAMQGIHSGAKGVKRLAIQGECGSNSHMAALRVAERMGWEAEVAPCTVSREVFARLAEGSVDVAVLPIENTLHGSVAEHYDLLLENSVRVTGETLLRIRHNVIAAAGVGMGDVHRVLSHPVALSQCRRWLAAHPEVEAVPFYDTAGSVKHVLEAGARDAAGIAAELAAEEYGGVVLEAGIEDHHENYTRFYTLERGAAREVAGADKISLAFTLEHRPGSLVEALKAFEQAGVNLTKIESRPVHGQPWEYVFFVDGRYSTVEQGDRAVKALRGVSGRVWELGRYKGA